MSYDERAELAAIWPYFGLEVVTERLALRVPVSHELVELTKAAAEHRIHDDQTMPFNSAWALLPDGKFQRQMVAHYWERQSSWEQGRAELLLVVFERQGNRPIGCISLHGAEPKQLRVYGMGAWLLSNKQDRHYGQEAAAGAIELAFRGLEARQILAAYWEDNPRSGHAQNKLGLIDTQYEWQMRPGLKAQPEEPKLVQKTALDRQDWQGRSEIEIIGLQPCRQLLDLDS